MALRRTASTHLPWTILVLAWKLVSARTFFILLCGFLLGWGSRYLRIIIRCLISSQDEGALYNFEHGMLNLPIECKTMWMNMGYWEGTDQFDVACENLLKLILEKAGLATSTIRPPRLILDLGFGCGDSLLYLADPEKSRGNGDGRGLPITDRYIGLTLDHKQRDLAMKRMESARLQVPDNFSAKLLCEDAAKPSTWSASLKCQLRRSLPSAASPPPSPPPPPAVSRHRGRYNRNNMVIQTSQHRYAGGLEPNVSATSGSTPEAVDDTRTEKWVLALDCLYHFFPSREEIFRYSGKELGASIMAFDLLLAPDISNFDWLKLWVICLFISAPISNFMVESEYKQQLEASGYSTGTILMDDITGDCFKQLAQFLDKREEELSGLGIHSFDRFRLAKWMFQWFARGKVVRAYIVVAKLS